MDPESPSSSDGSTRRPQGGLLRQEAADHEKLLREKFIMALRINYLEEQLLLLKNGEGSTNPEVLTELAGLRSTVRKHQNELHQDAAKWMRLVDELRAELDHVRAGHGHQKEKSSAAIQTSTDQREDICQKLHEELGDREKQLQAAVEDASDLRCHVKKLTTDLEHQGRAMRALKKDHEQALDTIYDLETQARQMIKQDEQMRDARFEEQRIKYEREVNLLGEKTKNAEVNSEKAGEALCRARSDVRALEGAQKILLEELKDQKESNRILLEDLQEYYKQYKVVFRENTDLLQATKIYKTAVADRDVGIKKYRVMIKKYIRKLQQRSSLQEVENQLMDQLQETKAIILATSQRLENTQTGNMNDNIRRSVKTIERVLDKITSVTSEVQQQHL